MSTEDSPLVSDEQPVKKPASTKQELAFDLVGFLGTVAAVMVFDWKAKDVIWGLWICSLTFGYTTIVLAILAPVFRASGVEKVASALGGLFLLGFFTVHFGMFHFVHGQFLNGFFPITGGGVGFLNPVVMIGVPLTLYWPMVLATFVSRFSDLPFSSRSVMDFGKDVMMKPYANVIRMHLLIFVFAGLHAFNMSDLAIYPVLLFYFFPWSLLLRIKPKPVLAS